MKKKIVVILSLFLLCGCTMTPIAETEATKETPTFVTIERSSDWMVVYHKDTKVMYAVSDGSYNRGIFTVLVNAYGKPMIYEGGTE